MQVQTAEAEAARSRDAHLEPLSSPKTLWVFSTRAAQVLALILNVLDCPRYAGCGGRSGLGGDFNTVRAGAREDAYHLARAWSTAWPVKTRAIRTPCDILDYLFRSRAVGPRRQRLGERFGSDHYPVAEPSHRTEPDP